MNKSYIYSIMAFVAILFTFQSCKKDSDETVETENYKGIFVVNEGGFGKSNGSIGLYKPGTKTYFDAFKKANDRPLGDVVQSMTEINGKYYVVVNNSNKIEVLNTNDFKATTQISTNSPRYILAVTSAKAYISNLYSNTVKVLDLGSNSISNSIDIHHNSESMALMGGSVYVGNYDNKLMLIDAATDSLTDSIATPDGLGKIVKISSTRIAVLCSGLVDWSSGSVLKNGKILFINSDSAAIERSFDLGTGSYGGSMVYVSNDNAIYFSLGNNVISRMDMNGIITEFKKLDAGRSVYGLTFNAATGELFVTDAGDFNSDGTVMSFDLNGNKTNEFKAGIAPSSILSVN